MKKELIAPSLLLAGLTFIGAGCGGSGSNTTGTGGTGGTTGAQTVEIFSWWIAPGEAQALQALVDVNKTNYPDDRIYNAAANSGSDARMLLAQRLAANDPPDLFQQNAADLPAFLTAHPGSLVALDDLFTQQHLDTAVLPDIIDGVTVGGHIYAMPVNIHRENSFFYNKQIFAQNNLQPPTTIDEFLTTCSALRAAGITPVATVFQGWILRIMFNSIAMGVMGTDTFEAFMTGGPRPDAALMTAIDVFASVLDTDINSDAADPALGWTDAAAKVTGGQAAMFFHGDWAKGYYEQLGSTPGVDFGVLAAPGAADMFWEDVDTFSLPVGAKNPTGALDFMTTIGSTAGQVAFNNLKGSSPIRPDVPAAQLDSEGQATLIDLMNARFRTRVVSHDAWDTALLTFATDHDKNALFQAYVDTPPVQ